MEMVENALSYSVFAGNANKRGAPGHLHLHFRAFGRRVCPKRLTGSHAMQGQSLNNWVLSLLRKMESDSAVLTLVGTLFHHWGAKTEKTGAGFVCSQRWRYQPDRWCSGVKCSRWGCVVWPLFGSRWIQLCWPPGGGSHGRIWVDCKRGTLHILDTLPRLSRRGWESSQDSSRFYTGQQAANLAVPLAARSADLDRRR